MGSQMTRVRNAGQMMVSAMIERRGVQVSFADGCHGLVPFAKIRDLDPRKTETLTLDIPDPYTLVLQATDGAIVELPWDFVRHYCDRFYRTQSDRVGQQGRATLGRRIRSAREQAGLTQEALAAAASIGRVTLTRIENGEQSPKLQTLMDLAQALGKPVEDLLVGQHAGE